MSKLNVEDISHLAHLSRLELTPEEQERYAEQLSSVVGYIEQLQKVDTSAIHDLHGVTGLQNILAADLPREATSLTAVSREELLKGTPVQEDNFIIVRAVMGEEVGA